MFLVETMLVAFQHLLPTDCFGDTTQRSVVSFFFVFMVKREGGRRIGACRTPGTDINKMAEHLATFRLLNFFKNYSYENIQHSNIFLV